MTTPLEQFPQMGNSAEGELDQVEHPNTNGQEGELLSLLKDIRDAREDSLALMQERWRAVDYPQKAISLMKRPNKSWSGIDPGWVVKNRDDPIDGRDFLLGLLRPKHNMDLARGALKGWMSRNPHHFRVLKDLTAQLEGNTDVRFEWPEGRIEVKGSRYPQWIPAGPGRSIEVIYANSDTSLKIAHPPDASCSLLQPELYQNEAYFRSDIPKCGVFVSLLVDRASGVIEYKNAVGVVCFVQKSNSWDPRFLEGHVNVWRERSCVERVGRVSSFRNSASIQSTVMVHYMRCFVPYRRTRLSTKPPGPGLRCKREKITFQSFYDASEIRLTERRYSVAVNMLPISYTPLLTLGHFGLLSIHDDRGLRIASDKLFETSSALGSGIPQDQKPWRKYDIHLAGLCTGVSMFQYQICAFTDSWEENWRLTIKEIDRMVLLKLEILNDRDRVRKLVLDNEDDAAVLYFKALQCLNYFSDTVRSAQVYLDELASHSREQLFGNEWFGYISNTDKEDTKAILCHNWKMVSQRQREASTKILSMLERTTNEVKSLQSGLFNVQSITAAQKSLKEAQKSIELNRYLLVFTIVTIVFLPPTFAATFFGMDAFGLETDQATRKLFWTVFTILSGVTYILATVGLFGLHFIATKRKQLTARIASKWNQVLTIFRDRQSNKDSDRSN